MDEMVTTRMDKGMKSLAYLFLAALLWTIWSYENVITTGKLKEKPYSTIYENNGISNAKSLLNYENVEALKVKDLKWKYENVNAREGSLISRDVGQTFDDNNVPNDDEKFDVKSLKHFKFDVENKKPNDDETNLNVKQPVQKVVPDGSLRPILKHSLEEADHNVFFIADVEAQTQKKMLVDVLWSSPLMMNLKLSIVTVHKAEPLLVQINLTQFREPGGAVTTAKDAEEMDVGMYRSWKPLILPYLKGLMIENTKNLRYSARDRRLKIAQLDMKKSRFSSYSMVAVPCQEISIEVPVNIRS